MNIEEISIDFCENNECENCPIYKKGIDYRTEKEKKLLHVPCVENLMKWLKEEGNINELRFKH